MQISVSRQSNRLRQTNEIVWYPRFIADFNYVLVMKLAAQHYFFVIPNYAWRFEFFGSSIYFLVFILFSNLRFFIGRQKCPYWCQWCGITSHHCWSCRHWNQGRCSSNACWRWVISRNFSSKLNFCLKPNFFYFFRNGRYGWHGRNARHDVKKPLKALSQNERAK